MKIITFSYGSARNPKTWSNVPYYTVKALEEQGHIVYCEDIGPKTQFMNGVVRLSEKAVRFLLGRDTRLLLADFPIVKRWCYDSCIKKAIEAHPDADRLLFFSYSASGNGIVDIPSILFHDFTIEYAIHMLHKRNIKWYEKHLIKAQDEIMRNADCVVSLFPKAADHYLEYYQTKNIYKMKGHILNCNENLDDLAEVLDEKCKSREILFIGRKAYKAGLNCLVSAVEKYNATHLEEESIGITVIGMTKADIKVEFSGKITFHGFLNKIAEKEKQTYYDAIRSSRFIVNTTKNWGGISSITEAMLFGTPVITSPYDEFVEIFGEAIQFGYFCAGEDVDGLVEQIENMMVLNKDEYIKMCLAAHESVKDFTYENCVKDILNACDDILKKNTKAYMLPDCK